MPEGDLLRGQHVQVHGRLREARGAEGLADAAVGGLVARGDEERGLGEGAAGRARRLDHRVVGGVPQLGRGHQARHVVDRLALPRGQEAVGQVGANREIARGRRGAPEPEDGVLRPKHERRIDRDREPSRHLGSLLKPGREQVLGEHRDL